MILTQSTIDHLHRHHHNFSAIVDNNEEPPRKSWLKLNASWIKSEVNYKF